MYSPAFSTEKGLPGQIKKISSKNLKVLHYSPGKMRIARNTTYYDNKV